MTLFRTRFNKDIVTEFLPPTRRQQGKPASVIILCKGMPGAPKANETMEFWAKKGFWVFFPRYRGTWESGGEFLKCSPHEDILDVIDELPKGFTDLWSGKKYKVRPTELYVFGASFGGPAAILCSRDPRVTKAVAFASLVSWSVETSGEPMGKLGKFIPQAFGNCYRFSRRNWNRLSRGEFYDPVREIASVTGKKLLMLHAKDDTVVPFAPTKKFAEKIGAQFVALQTGGHFGYLRSTEPRLYKVIRKFIRPGH